jgi:steroid 5-alpha reductase family enzyme
MTASIFIAGLVGVSAALSVVMTGAWLSWRKTRNSGWVDTIWTFGLGAVGWLGALVPVFAARSSPRIGLVAAMAAVWSLRLGFHIARRTTAIVDDPRYARLVRGRGADASRQ